MLSLAPALLSLLLATSEGQPAPPAADDEARIEALVAAEQASREQAVIEREEAMVLEAQEQEAQVATTFPPPRGTPVAPEDLPKMKGYAVVVRTRAGGTRYGIVDDVDRADLLLHVQMRGGYARFRVPRRQIESVEAD